MALKTNAEFEGKLTCTFKSDRKNLENFLQAENSDFILRNKTAELNQNENSK